MIQILCVRENDLGDFLNRFRVFVIARFWDFVFVRNFLRVCAPHCACKCVYEGDCVRLAVVQEFDYIS